VILKGSRSLTLSAETFKEHKKGKIMIASLVFILGVVFGSFFNVVIYRVPLEKSIAKGRSMCPSCGHVLTSVELIPVVSIIMQGFKCKHCKEPISPRYLIVELLTGLLWLASYLIFQDQGPWMVVSACLLVSLCLIIGYIDFDTQYISDSVLLVFWLGRMAVTFFTNEFNWELLFSLLVGAGLYSLILSSKLPQAREFKRWVTSEVLPSIRKQGGFIREDLDEDAFIALFTGQKKLREQQATMLEDIDYLKSEQPIHPSYAQSLLKKRKARVVACLGGIDSPAYADKIFAQSVFRQAEIDFKDHFNISRYDLLPKKFAEAALKYWMTCEPSTNTKMKIMELNAFSQA